MALRVLSYNILYGGQDRLASIRGVIHQQGPDVVALLEANERGHAEMLASELRMKLVFGPANSEFHVAWLSRLPLLRVENHRLALFSKTLLEIEVPWQGRSLSLFATHLSAGRQQASDLYRVEEMRAILRILRQCGSRPHALVGDFNSLHPDDPIDLPVYLATGAEEGEDDGPGQAFARLVIPLLLEAGYTDCYRALHGQTPGYTYKLPAPSLRLDYIFASPELAGQLARCDVVTGADALIASDHFPVCAEFS